MFYPEPGRVASLGAPHEYPPTPRADTPSESAARCQRLPGAPSADGAEAVSARNCSIAATIAAASLWEAGSVTSSIRGRGGWRSPFLCHLGAGL